MAFLVFEVLIGFEIYCVSEILTLFQYACNG